MKTPTREEEAFSFFCKAYGHHTAGDTQAAIVNYKKSIEVHPTAEAHTFLGWTYSSMDRFDQAIEECHKAIAIDPDLGNPYNDIGAYLIEKGDLDEALVFLDKALKAKRYEESCFPHYNIGRIWEAKGDVDRAVKAYRKALKEDPDYVAARIALRKLGGIFN